MSLVLYKPDVSLKTEYTIENSYKYRFHGFKKDLAFHDLDQIYQNTPSINPSIPSYVRHNTMVMATKKLMENL